MTRPGGRTDPAPLRVVIAGGGTGGHLYPGLAVARELLARHAETIVTFAGTTSGIEARVLPREGFVLDTIRSGALKGQSVASLARGLALVPISMLDAWAILSRRRPAVVVGVGGYSSGPVVAMAALRRIPTLVLEQNAVPGLANRLLARVVDAAALTYEEARSWFPRNGFVTGNPVRPGFAGGPEASVPAEAPGRRRRVLVFGGSQGAHAINVAMMEAARRLCALDPVPDIVHQTGERDLDTVREAYRHVGLDARVEPFLHDMDREMRAADLVICRAGATTLAELTVAAKPAILVPLPTATDDHQRKNAEALARAGAAQVLEQRDLSGEALAATIETLLTGEAERARMAAAAARTARPDAAQRIAECILALAAGRGSR